LAPGLRERQDVRHECLLLADSVEKIDSRRYEVAAVKLRPRRTAAIERYELA
jgi:hypothetical protein